jgi:hypothetical protein
VKPLQKQGESRLDGASALLKRFQIWKQINRKLKSCQHGMRCGLTSGSKVANHLRFYEPLRASGERAIWEKQKALQEPAGVILPDDERVEDAGLELEPLTKEA